MNHGQVYVCVIGAEDHVTEIEIFIFHGAMSLEKILNGN